MSVMGAPRVAWEWNDSEHRCRYRLVVRQIDGKNRYGVEYEDVDGMMQTSWRAASSGNWSDALLKDLIARTERGTK